MLNVGLLGAFWNNMLLALFVRLQQRFGSCEERGHSSSVVERNWDPSERKEVRQAVRERERSKDSVRESYNISQKVCGHQNITPI